MPLAALPIRPTQPPYSRPTLGAGAGGCIVRAERVPFTAHFARACSLPTTHPTPPKKPRKRPPPPARYHCRSSKPPDRSPRGQPPPRAATYLTLDIRICLSTSSIVILNTRLTELSNILAHTNIIGMQKISRSFR